MDRKQISGFTSSSTVMLRQRTPWGSSSWRREHSIFSPSLFLRNWKKTLWENQTAKPSQTKPNQTSVDKTVNQTKEHNKFLTQTTFHLLFDLWSKETKTKPNQTKYFFPTCRRPPDLESGKDNLPISPPDHPQPCASQRRKSGRKLFSSFLFLFFWKFFQVFLVF